MSKKHIIEVDVNGERSSLSVFSPLKSNGEADSGYRIAGPKAWGGYSNFTSFKITETPLVNFVKKHATDIAEALKSGSRYFKGENKDITLKVFKHESGNSKILLSIDDIDFFLAGDKTLNEKECKRKFIKSRQSDFFTYIKDYCTPSAKRRITE